MSYIIDSHHITMSVNGAQEDVDFHVKVLGLRLIKRTVLFDGTIPIYHLYYSNADGDPSAVLTTFPFGQAGIYGRRGTNQAREVLLAVPAGSLNYWSSRLHERAADVQDATVFHRRRVLFRHPCGIEYQLVEVDNDPRRGYGGNGVPEEYAIHGIYGVGVHVTGPDTAVEFAANHLGAREGVTEGDRFGLDAGKSGLGGAVELVVNRTDEPGTWTYGAGTIHHFAWNADTLENQNDLKLEIEGAGYTDMSELRDRKYFKSVYVRSPGGALFELAVTHNEGGWDCDESPRELGKRFQLPEQFEARREEILGRLEPIGL
ncbi:glyoxalase [Mycobacterium colombiense]|uniref:Glyoxalase n=1 Tax=Mycobacterium colombiense TaxID=339268 RepID=A0A1A3IHG6_9MYCO|nr:VOC family protein [Mycobacterium colombiense]OBJ14819.1 glyoxalase [Mycobacterium colombiense]OBJ60037.1 glyoxalase [Mycobacterium colombiense]OBK67926.1 glyoxalase [Mycobacterium colombiense]OMB89675.1 glyoxalase [Mycobacterium colombiense]OMC15249.1 glyoxalase [Mycobacterium colombiense]